MVCGKVVISFVQHTVLLVALALWKCTLPLLGPSCGVKAVAFGTIEYSFLLRAYSATTSLVLSSTSTSFGQGHGELLLCPRIVRML